jgi:microcystin-dependent protein
MSANAFPANVQAPSAARSLAASTGGIAYKPPAGATTAMASESVPPAGGDAPHNSLMPYLTFYFCIALQGIFRPAVEGEDRLG